MTTNTAPAISLDDERMIRDGEAAVEYYNESRQESRKQIMPMARGLLAARRRYSADQDFGRWLDSSPYVHLEKDDRAALINIGKNEDFAAKFVRTTNLISPQTIWSAIGELMPVSYDTKPAPVSEQCEKSPEIPCITREIATPASEKDPTPVGQVVQAEPGRVSKQTLAKAAVGAFPKAELVLAHLLNKSTRTLLGQITSKKKNGGPIWQLLTLAIECGAYGPPSKADISKPNLRLILPWAPLSYAQRFDLTKTKDQKIVSAEILPVVNANRDLLSQDPERLSALVYEVATAPERMRQAAVAKEKRDVAIAQMPPSEREVIAFGTTLWPRASDDHAYAFTYDELCHAVWFSQMLFGSYPVNWKPLSKSLQTAHLIKFIEPMLKTPGWGIAVRDIFNAYAESPDGECRFPSPPINFRM